MPKTAEQILKAQGLTDADITAMAPMLNDPRYRAAIETPINALESERDQYAQRNREWEELNENTYKPALSAAEHDAQKARIEAAELREKIKIAKEYGYLGQEAEDKARLVIEENRRQQQSQTFDPKAHNVPTFDDIGRLADTYGESIAMGNDIAAEYRYLYGGKDLFEYVGADGTSRGMRALRNEAKAAKQSLDQYVAGKFNFQGKRQEIEAKKQADHDSEVGRKAVEEYALKHGSNPMTQSPMTSRNPFVPTNARDGKQPWENPAAGAERRNRAFQNEVKAQHVN